MRRTRPALYRLTLVFGVAALCLSTLAACEDPSGVGISFVGGDEGDPQASVFRAPSVESVPLPDQTGAFATAQNFRNFQALAGYVADPLFGTTVAQGYIDVLPPSTISDEFRERPVREAKLRLALSYAYGDTMTVTTLDVRQIEEEWTAVGATADTTFPVMDEVITSFDVTPGDTLIEVVLPDSWITANDTTLRSDDVSNLFHGFRLSTDGTSGAVYGFSGESQLELISAEDTVRYSASELFSGIVHTPAPSFPADLYPIQDGSGRGLGLVLRFDTLDTPALNTAFLRVNADTLASQADLPAGFVRPLARELALFGVSRSNDPVFITSTELDEEGAVYSFRSNTLTNILQELALERDSVEVNTGLYVSGFAVGVPPSRSSLDAVAIVAPPADTGPRAVLFLVPTD